MILKAFNKAKTNSDDKLICMTTKVDRTVARDFKMVATLLGKTQKELLEGYLTQTVNDYRSGRLQNG